MKRIGSILWKIGVRFGYMNLSFMEFVIVNIVLYNIVVFVEFSVFMVCFLVVLFIDKVWIWFI